MIDGKVLVQKLLVYANAFLGLEPRDMDYMQNLLLREFNLDSPLKEEIDVSDVCALNVPDLLVQEIESYAVENNIVLEQEKNLFSTYILGILCPRPSIVEKNFYDLKNKKGTLVACERFHDFCIKNNYVQKTAISKNQKWEYVDGDKYLEITINLSKPEKDNKQTAKLLTQAPTKKYPSCMICKENEGFMGSLTKPARQNLRTIGVTLDGEKWFWQYSPYAYFDQHLIAINTKHTPMHVSGDTIRKILDFVDAFPNYFIGSNASLPIIGGSILDHEHFQGGAHLMPMQKAKVLKEVACSVKGVKVGIIDWYLSALRVEGEDRKAVESVATKILECWSDYTDEQVGIYAKTTARHNAVSPIARKVDKTYIIDIIIRNNITSSEYPDGVFHAHPEYHNIKKEAIGLIEAMGLFILPARLKRQLGEVANMLCGQSQVSIEQVFDSNNDLYIHRFMIKELLEKGVVDSIAKADCMVRDKVNDVCKNILYNVSVFKNDEQGKRGFEKFIKAIGL